MKINFDLVEIFTDIQKTKCVRQNMRKDFANLIYTNGSGIDAHALAFKIYNGDADTEYNGREVELIRQYENLCSPCVIDAIERMLTDEDKTSER